MATMGIERREATCNLSATSRFARTTVGGMGFVDELLGRGKKVFLDLKFHDIGETVKQR